MKSNVWGASAPGWGLTVSKHFLALKFVQITFSDGESKMFGSGASFSNMSCQAYFL